MAKKRSQINIKIDPELLLSLTSESIKSGKILTEFVTEQLRNAPKNCRMLHLK